MTPNQREKQKEIQELLIGIVEANKGEFSRKTIKDLLNIMTTRMRLKDAEEDEISDLFRQLDINGNGKLSKDEIKVFTKQLMDIVISSTVIQDIDQRHKAP